MAGGKQVKGTKKRNSREHPPYHLVDSQLVPTSATQEDDSNEEEEVVNLGDNGVPNTQTQYQTQTQLQHTSTVLQGQTSNPSGRLALDPSLLWFEDGGPVLKAITRSIQGYYREPWRNYGEVDAGTKKHWWNLFSKHFTWAPELEDQVQRKFNMKAGERLRDMFYTVTKKMKGAKPYWVNEELHKRMMAIPEENETHKMRSKQNKLNRRGGSMSNVVEPSHYQGSISAAQHAKRMALKDGGKMPSAPEVFLKTHFKDIPGKGKVPANAKSKLIADTFQKKLEEATSQGVEKSPNQLYWETVGGRKKGLVKGLGRSGEFYYGTHQGRGLSSSQLYTPSIVTQMQEQFEQRVQNMRTEMESEIKSRVESQVQEQVAAQVQAQVSAQIAAMERRNKEIMDEMMNRITGFNNDTCSTLQPQHRDPRDDSGSGGGHATEACV